LAFCGGTDENSRAIRSRFCEGMVWIGVELDRGRKAANATTISAELSRVRVMVISTNENIVIARAARRLVGSAEQAAAE
jgi:acetate kinase